MKAFSLAILATGVQSAYSVYPVKPGEEFLALDMFAVNNRTLMSKWELFFVYDLDAEPDREPKDNFITITAIVRNTDVLLD